MQTALIIDDNPTNIHLLKKFLELYNINSIAAEDGMTGYQMAIDHQPDIIFTDLRMPRNTWDGYRTIGALKMHEDTAHIPIIAVTASGDEEQALKLGCDDVLMRPFRTGELRAKLVQVYPHIF